VTISQVEVLVEEPSAEAALGELLPRMLGQIPFTIHAHQGKADLLSSLPGRLKGYAQWMPKDWRIVVLVDADDDDCSRLKRALEQHAATAGLRTRTAAGGVPPWLVVNRIAIEELEAWFFGDWVATRTAYPRLKTTIPSQKRFRDPDAIRGGTWEALARLLKDAGYFTTGLPKIEVARTIALQMRPEANTSRSFRAFRDVLTELAG
jgi:hypothetical protein